MYNSKGVIINERNYENDKLNGDFIDWYDNGVVKSEGVFINDQLSGIVKYYNEEGKNIEEATFENGIKKQR